MNIKLTHKVSMGAPSPTLEALGRAWTRWVRVCGLLCGDARLWFHTLQCTCSHGRRIIRSRSPWDRQARFSSLFALQTAQVSVWPVRLSFFSSSLILPVSATSALAVFPRISNILVPRWSHAETRTVILANHHASAAYAKIANAY